MSKQSEHNQGQEDGAKANAFDEVMERFNPFHSSSYMQGFNHGIEQQSNSNPENRESGNSGSDSKESGCFLSTACVVSLGLSDDCHELNTLRRFRDNYLITMPNGLTEIDAYYELAPKIVAAINKRPDRLEIHRVIYNSLVDPCVRLISLGLLDEAFRLYKLQTQRLSSALI